MSVQLLSQLLKFQDQVNAIAPQILAAGRACRASIDPIQLLKFQDQVNAIAPQILAAGRACRASIDPISHAPETARHQPENEHDFWSYSTVDSAYAETATLSGPASQ